MHNLLLNFLIDITMYKDQIKEFPVIFSQHNCKLFSLILLSSSFFILNVRILNFDGLNKILN
jgi:hypothetical protein